MKKLGIGSVLFHHPFCERLAVLRRRELRLVEEIWFSIRPVDLANAMNVVAGNGGAAKQRVNPGDQFLQPIRVKEVGPERLECGGILVVDETHAAASFRSA